MTVLTIIFLDVLCGLLIFFLTPRFMELCEDLGGMITDGVQELGEAFINTVEEWKELFKRWSK